ncbi:MAG TPA: DUF2723 domain-containing protein [Candidatus Coprenecus stercoravium]|uniref:DUF2723 domain-containing protein n=1 Tax=Candidatus Coprenecus stercoravium TaxID=2840735 RepID=A0A9D2KAL2_9BACT|nr:DUF2723 domain-containing protein [Candidatus Coprenecus stercoravium]
MEQKKFTLLNRIFSVLVLLTASITYLLTIEPTASFWDCGEFIASSYKLEVGHAPGNPVFQMIARFFTMFASPEHAAMAVNIMSALCSAFTIFFLYLTIVHLGRRIIEKNGGGSALSLGEGISLIGAGVVGALAYCWSDTFWFSAVEAEVYAMSSLFTAAVFWMILKWEEQADTEYADRWIVAIAFLMGLSIGVHLLNLLTIPAIAFVYYYKKAPKVTAWGSVGVFAVSALILAVVLWGIIPYLPKIAALFDLLFVNVFHLPFNSGAAFFVLALLALCFLAVYLTYRKGSRIWNIITLSFTMIVVGYSAFAMVVIRSSNNTPTNEGQPDNPFALVKYLGREQYGKTPLLYGPTYASVPVDYTESKYYTKLGDRYYKADSPIDYIYPSESKMLFPRMHSKDPGHIRFYKSYTQGRGKTIPGTDEKMPTFADNLKFFFDYQVNWMYMRYFMWNFAGRQNDLHGQVPGDPVSGNWESGIGFIDRARLGDQSEGPDYIIHNKAKNHYYMLPLILGIIGLLFQLGKDKRNWWITFLLFFLTGIAIILYLNQPPYQVRERDYAYAGSFYVFSIWIGLAVMAVFDWLRKPASKVHIPEKVTATVVSVVLLGVPVLMAAENWDDHDRSGRYTARDMAYNYFMSTDDQAVFISHGDNDTFPLWYIQEVEGVRLDARVMNTSLLGIDWYIDQMQWKQYDAEPIKFTTPRANYLYGTNDYVFIRERFNRPILLSDAIALFNDPRVKINVAGRQESFIASKKLLIPVNKENVIKHGIVPEKDYDKILDTVCLELPAGKTMLDKTELMILDMLSNYEWDRPIYFMTQGGSLQIGIEPYLQFEGYTYKFVPIRSNTTFASVEQVDTEAMYDRVMNVYKMDNFADDIFVDYQNLSTFNGVQSQRFVFVQTANALLAEGDTTRTVEVLDRMQEVFPDRNFPLNSSAAVHYVNELMVIKAIELYISCGETEKALDLADRFINETMKGVKLFSQPYHGSVLSQSDLESHFQMYQYAVETVSKVDMEKAEAYSSALKDFINSLV